MNINDNNTQTLNQDNFASMDIASSDLPLGIDEEDLLDMDKYNKGLINLIKEADTPITIALQGEWGSGKSSLMNKIKGELCEGENAPFYGITIETWQFDLLDASSKNASSQAVVNILKSMIDQIIDLKPNKERQDRIDEIINKIAIAVSSAKSIYDIIGDPFLSQVGLSKTTVGFLSKIVNIIKDSVNKNKSSNIDKKHFDNASLIGQLHNEVKDLVDDVLDKSNYKQVKHITVVQDYSDNVSVDFKSTAKPFSQFEVQKFSCVIVRFIVALCNIAGYSINVLYLMCWQCLICVFDFVFQIVKLLWDIFCYILKLLSDIVCYSLRELYCVFSNLNQLSKMNGDPDSNNNNKKKGFIFFIDDLDRVEPKIALEILEILKNVFNIKRCVFIIAVDQYVLVEPIKIKLGLKGDNINKNSKSSDLDNINKNSKSSDLIECKRYLEKLIQLTVPVPMTLYDVKLLIQKRLSEISLFTAEELKSNEIADFVANAVQLSIGKNPRLIKRFINSLVVYNIILCASLSRQIYKETQKRIDNPGKTYLYIRKVFVIVFCIYVAYPKIFNLMLKRPFFGDWNDEFADTFGAKAVGDEVLKAISKSIGFDIKKYPHKLALFRICVSDGSLLKKWVAIMKLLDKINEVVEEYIKSSSDKDPEPNEVYSEVKHIVPWLIDIVYHNSLSIDNRI